MMQTCPTDFVSDGEPDEEEAIPPIQLFSRDVKKYTGDALTLLLPRLMNPHDIAFISVWIL